MKLFLILLAIGLLFVVTGCGGKGNTLNILPKSSASVNQGKNPGGTGRSESRGKLPGRNRRDFNA